MKQINFDNDEIIKRLKNNIKENEKILFQKNYNGQHEENKKKMKKTSKNENKF